MACWDNSCVICVGSTGTGKSATIQTCTQQPVKTSSCASLNTWQCDIYKDLRNPDSSVMWVDTIGWDDAEGRKDHESFMELLKFINSHGLNRIYAIIWTVNPEIRCSQTLQRQAAFIDKLKKREIWKNVIIIAKGNEETSEDCQGAVAAAKKYCGNIELMTLSYNYLENAEAKLRDKLKEDCELQDMYHTFTTEKVYELISNKLGLIEGTVQVVLNNYKCLDCGVEGDERLLPEKCHIVKLMIHRQKLSNIHIGELEAFHPLPLEKIHTGDVYFHFTDEVESHAERQPQQTRHVRLAQEAYSVPMALLSCVEWAWNFGDGIAKTVHEVMRKPDISNYTCCNQDQSSEGCKSVWKCCKAEENNAGCKRWYNCCEVEYTEGVEKGCMKLHGCCMKPELSEGCEAVCRGCGNPWGEAKSACFVKKHNLIKIS